MYLEELLKHAYLQSSEPTDDEIVLLPAGCSSQVDRHLVVGRSKFEEVLMNNRASDPTSEAILTTIGRADKAPGDPLWATMLQRESVLDRFTALCNEETAERLSAIGQEDATPSPGYVPSMDGFPGFQPPPPFEEAPPVAGETVPDVSPVFGADEPEVIGSNGMFADGFGTGPVAPEPEPAVDSGSEDAPHFSPFTMPGTEDVSATGTGTIPGAEFVPPMEVPATSGGGQSLPAENPVGAVAPNSWGIPDSGDGMSLYLDDPSKHPVYDAECAEEAAEGEAEGEAPIEATGDPGVATIGVAGEDGIFGLAPTGIAPEAASATGTGDLAGQESATAPEYDFGASVIFGGATPEFEPESAEAQGNPEGLMGAELEASPSFGAEFGFSLGGAAAHEADAGEAPDFEPSAFEGLADGPPLVPPIFGDSSDGVPPGPPAFEPMGEVPAPPVFEVSSEESAEGVPAFEPPVFEPFAEGPAFEVGSAEPAPAPEPEPPELEGAFVPSALGALEGSEEPALTSGGSVFEDAFSALTPEPQSYQEPPNLELKDVPPALEQEAAALRGELVPDGAPAGFEQEEVIPAREGEGYQAPDSNTPEAGPFTPAVGVDLLGADAIDGAEEGGAEDIAPPAESADAPVPERAREVDNNQHLQAVRESFSTFHELVKQYTLDAILRTNHMDAVQLCEELVQQFPSFEDQASDSLQRYPGDYNRAAIDLVRSLELEAESAVLTGDLDRAEKCIAPVCKLIYS